MGSIVVSAFKQDNCDYAKVSVLAFYRKKGDIAVNTLPTVGHSARQERSERTRMRLIDVAAEMFAAVGYEAASTRTIAKRAGTNVVSISYYFCNKRGLHQAVAEHIGKNIAERLRPTCQRARQALQSMSLTHDMMVPMFACFMVEFAQLLMSEDISSSWFRFVCREQLFATDAFEAIHESTLPFLKLAGEFIAKLTDRPTASLETRIQLLAVISMLKFARTDRATVARVLGRSDLDQESLQIVIQVLRRNIEAMFASAACARSGV